MTDIQKLKALAEAVRELEDQPEKSYEHEEAKDALWLHMHCHTVLDLIAEIETLGRYLCTCRDCGGEGALHTGRWHSHHHMEPPEPEMEKCGECDGTGLLGEIQDLHQVIAERDQLKAENTDLHATLQAAKGEIERLKGECEALRATSDLKALLPDLGDALEDLELHGRHSDQGYRKLKDWYRKVALAYRVIDGPMFGAEHGELVSQNTWLRSVVEHYAQQHAPLEPIPDREGWSTRLPGYDLPALLRDAERYRWLREQEALEGGIAILPVGLWVKPAMLCTTPFDSGEMTDSVIDAAMSKGEQS